MAFSAAERFQEAALGRPTILVVDDDLDAHRVIHLALRPLGARFVAAWDGLAAVWVAQRESPDLILLDFGLPASDGLTVIRRLRMLTGTVRTPIVVLGARDPVFSEGPLLEAGAACYLQRPVEAETLLATAGDLLAATGRVRLSA